MNKKIITRKVFLRSVIESELPKFVKAVKFSKADFVSLHQDGFAFDYQNEEYILLGMAIKYAGLYGKEVHIFGKNRDTLKDHAIRPFN